MKNTKLNHVTLPNVRTNKQLKELVFQYCNELGLSYGTLVNLLLNDWIRGKIKIEVMPRDEEGFNSEKSQLMLELIKDAKNGKNIVKGKKKTS